MGGCLCCIEKNGDSNEVEFQKKIKPEQGTAVLVNYSSNVKIFNDTLIFFVDLQAKQKLKRARMFFQTRSGRWQRICWQCSSFEHFMYF